MEALQLCTLLLPPASRRKLQLLMRMMSRISQNVDMPRLHPAIGTRTLVRMLRPPLRLLSIKSQSSSRGEDPGIYRLFWLSDDSHLLRLRSGQRRGVRPGRAAGHSTGLVPDGPPAEHLVGARVPAQHYQRPPAVSSISAGTRRKDPKSKAQ